ncbi:unnamed protein product [Closterium sp. NIES-53]
MAARIASKSRSKIATPDLSRSPQRGISVASGNWARQASHPQTPGAPRTTHEAAGATGSHESAAAAGVPAAQLRLYQLDLRRRRLRLLHPSRHCHRRLHLQRCHRSPYLCHHPHPHPLLRLHRHYRLPHHLLQRPCPACPCWCGASH